jgi:hypothetical protein
MRFTTIILLYGGNIYFLRLQIVRSIFLNRVMVVVINRPIIGNNTEVLLLTTLGLVGTWSIFRLFY